MVEAEAGSAAAPPIYEHSTTAHNRRLYVFGGVKEQKLQNTLWTFDLCKPKNTDPKQITKRNHPLHSPNKISVIAHSE